MSLSSLLKRICLRIDEGLYVAKSAFKVDDQCGRALDVTQLEERILMSASPLAVAAEAIDATPAQTTELADQRLLDVVADSVLPQPPNLEHAATIEASLTTSNQQTLELLFIDGSISNLDQMVADLESENSRDDSRTLEIVVLDTERDGIAQITSTLIQHNSVDGIHVVSHGDAGNVQLGSTTLSLSNLDTYRGAITAWQHSMSEQADVLFYGCNLAATEEGRELMQQIAAECDCDVSASEDLTGHENLGGDWDLEYEVGEIDTNIAFSEELQSTWEEVLATITVTTTDDENDGDTSSIAALLASSGGTGISLREAVLATNNTAGADTINFNIAGSGTQVINLSSALDTITDEVTIDGTTQTGWVEGSFLPIVIDGNDGAFDGLNFSSTADNSEVRGLVIRDFDSDTIDILAGADDITIAGNFIGQFNSDGTDAGDGEANTFSGVRVQSDNVTIGGSTVADRNLFSGNEFGVLIRGTATNTVVSGNYFGTDITGAALTASNNDYGIYVMETVTGGTIGGSTTTEGNVFAGMNVNSVTLRNEDNDNFTIQNNLIGVSADGTTRLDFNGGTGSAIYITNGGDNTQILDNLIAGARYAGIELDASGISDGTLIQGNTIGTDAGGTQNWGVGETGILIENATNTTIGGIGAGEGNTVAFSGQVDAIYGAGVAIQDGGTGNTIRGNSIYSNSLAGIDLSAGTSIDGPTANDAGDSDSGSNSLQNWAVLTSAAVADIGTFSFDLDTSTLQNRAYYVDFYASTDRDGGQVEGARYLGTWSGSTDGSVEYNTLSGITLAPGEYITTVTTDVLNAESSEFSNYAVAVDSDGNVAPEDLITTSTTGGGLSINSDGGNDVYLEADDGGALLGGLGSVSVEIDAAVSVSSFPYLIDYAVAGESNEFAILVSSDNIRVVIDGVGNTFSSTVDSINFRDGVRRTIGVTWDGTTGDLSLYADGKWQQTISGVKTGYSLATGGNLVIGGDQDSVGGDFATNQMMSAELYDIRLFDDVRTASEIAASYRSDLPYDEEGMIANWKFDQLSTDGVVLDAVSGNNLTLKHVAQSGFTTSEASLTFGVNENAIDGTVVGQVAGVDEEREAKIASLLAADTDLVYSAEAGKFYKISSGQLVYGSAESTASSATLNGVTGQLVTIRSAAEQAFVTDYANGSAFWLGATDAAIEGEWRWQDAGDDAELFWNGDSNGYGLNGAYTNWLSGQPDGSGNQARVRSDGTWDDQGSGDDLYIVEWNADDVLDSTDALTYAITSQTVAGAFEIDADTGQIRVRDGLLLDADTQATHTITVEVSDTNTPTANTYTEDFTISLNNLVEDNNAPTDLSSGIELNTDGGNDAYLVADDGGAIFGGLTEVTLEMNFRSDRADIDQFTFFSYASPSADNEFLLIANNGILELWTNASNGGIRQATGVSAAPLFDGHPHSLAVSWNSSGGHWAIYIDGELTGSGSGYKSGVTLAGGGNFVIGQEHDTPTGGFQSAQTFDGTLYDVRIWNEVRSEAEIALNHQHKFDSGNLPSGLIANWQMDGFNGSNEVVDVVSGNNLSIGHATGGGFTASTPVEDLHISENAVDGASVGFVVPSDPDSPQDIVFDGSFLEDTSSSTVSSPSTFGGWTVTQDNVNVVTTWEPGPLGGNAIDLQGGNNTNGEIRQTLTTEVGRQYQVVFAMSGNFAGGETVKDLRVSAGGESHDFTATAPDGYNLATNIGWTDRSFSFTADSTSTDLSFLSTDAPSAFGAIISDVRVIEIPAAVTTILNNDPTLSYDAATDKFYRAVNESVTWSDAQAAAVSASLNGVSGQLLTIRSAYENELARSFDSLGNYWLGGSDQETEGNFQWYQGDEAGDTFWTGGVAGSGTPGNYENFAPAAPDDFGGDQDFVYINRSAGLWDDAGAGTRDYVIEWDASEVLSNFTFSLTDDAGGRFTIDSSTGEVTVADGSLIDFEAATSHNIDVQVTDAAGNSYNEVMSIAIDNELDANQTVPAAQTIAEDGTLTFINGTATEVSVNDSFAGTNSPMRVTLSVNDGVLNLSGTTGITFVEGANGSSAFVIDGTESHINAALNNMTFTPTDNFNGSVSLNMTTALAADLDGRYEFEGNANDTSNGTNNPGTLVGATTTPDATRGGEVLLLDAAGEHVEIAGRFNTPTDATLAAWVNLDAGIADAEIISLGNNLFLRADAVGSGLTLGYYQGSGVWNFVNATGVNLDGEGWSHVAATFDDTNNLVTVFLNGQEVASLSTTDSIDWTHDANTSLVTTIGAHGNGAAFDFRGLIDDARVYTRALSADEIAALAADQTEASDSVAITVDPVNDAPVVSGPPSAYSATEQTNLSIHGTGFSVSDVDAASGNVTATVAVGEGTISISVGDSGVAITSGNGTGSVVIQGNVSEINNLLTDGGTGTITYVNASDAPAASTTITITVNDEGNTGTDPGLTGDGTSEEGSASQTINITGVNDAPTLDNSGAPTMTSITEDDVNNGGMTVAALLATGAGADPISDVDGDPEGIAITARVNGRGQWQYSVNGGTNWSNVGTVSETQALLLRATDLVRFNPDGQNGTVKTFDFRAWDQSSGTPGDKVDTSTNGGSTAFSTAIETASITTTDVNDAPVLDNSGTINLNAQAEDSGSPSGAVGTAITDFITNGGNVTDVDASSQAGIAITDSDATNGTWWYSLDSGSNWNALGAVSETSARVLNASSITRLYFEPNADFNGTIADAITFHAWDQTSGVNGGVADLSDNTVSDQFSTVSYSNNDGTTNWTSDWIEVDADGGGASGGRILVRSGGDLEIRARNVNDNISREVDLSGATSAILSFDYNNLLGSGDVIVVQASNNGGSSYTTLSGGTFSSSLNTGSGTFSLDISSFIAADTNIRFYISGAGDENDLLIDNVQITSPSGNTGGSSAFSIDSDSASLTVTAVNDVPTIINLSGDTLNYNEGDGAVVVEQGANAVISDIDGGDFNTGTLTVSIASGGDAAEDVLAIRNQGTSAGQVGISGSDVSFGGTTVGSFTGGTGGTDLVVTFNASSTPLAATMILQNITYENTDTTAPTTGARTVEFEVTDGDGGTSLTHSTTVNVAAANDPATVAVNTGITVAEGGSVVIGTANLNEGDPDDDGADVIYRARIDINGGSLFLNGTVLEQNDTFTQADIDAGRISYVHAGGEDATEVIRLAINDVGNSGETNFQIAVAVTGQNDAPAAADDPVGTFDPVTDLDTIGFWRLGESSGTTAVDAAGSNNGTYNNVTLGAAGAITGDTAADFNGIDSHVNLGALEVSGSGITMAAWINGDDFGTADGRIISKAEGATNADHSWMLSVFDVGADTYMRLRISAGNHTELLIAQAPSLNIGQWYHVAGTYDQATGEMAIYVDGDLVEFGAHSVGGAVDQDPSRDVWIGGNPVSGNHFDGRIDEALIVERALTAGEISALADQTPPDYSVAENSTLSINAANGVLRNDSDVEGDALTVSEVNGVGASVGNQITLASGALLTVNADGSFDYDPNGQFESLGVGQTGTDSFTYTLSDGTATDSASVVVNITGANDAAVITNLDGDALLYNAGTGAVVLDQGSASVATDIDSANLATGSLTVSLTGAVPAEDVFSIVNEGTAAGEIGFDGSNVTYGGVQFGTATGGSGGTDLVISFDTNATLNAVSALLNNITYENTGGATPTTGARLANFVIDDGDGGVSATTGVSINVVSTATAVIRDEFNAVSYSNNDGTVNWSNSWTELGESTSPTAGNVEVDAAQDAVEIGSGPTLLLFATDITGLGIQRTADLSNAHDAVLSLDAWKSGVGSGDVSVQVSTNGSTWTTLANLDFSSLSTSRTNLEYDISSHMSATTSIRVVGSGTVGGVLQSGYYWLDNISINYTPNTAPVVSLSGGSASFTENGGAISIDGSATVFDAESPDFDGGTLTVDFTAGATSNDRLGIEDQGTGVGQIGVSGSTVSFEGTTIGTFAGGSDGSTPLVITLDSSADSAAAQALARSITFDNVSENPSATTRTARFVLTDGDGGTSTAVTRTISVSDINDAPVLDNTPAPSLTAITEDEIGGGMTVAAILATGGGGDPITDVDGDPEGIAIIGRSGVNGTWEYSFDGTNWSNVGNVNPSNARLLRATDFVRFSPDGTNGASNSFVFRAWDQSTGTAGQLVDASSTGGSTAFSTAGATASINVTDVNDAPVLDNSGSLNLATQAEDSGAPVGAVGTVITDIVQLGGNVTDIDTSSQTGIAVTAADTTNGTWWYTIDGGTNWNALGAVSDSSARVLNANSNTRIYFEPNANFNGTISNALTFRAWDRSAGTSGSLQNASVNGGTTAFSTASETADLSISAGNDAPVLTAPGGSVNLTENAGITPFNAESFTDIDSADLNSGSLTFTVTSTPNASDDTLTLSTMGGIVNITGGVNVFVSGTQVGTVSGLDTSGPLTISFNANSTPASAETLLQAFFIRNLSDDPTPGTRAIEVVATDGAGGTSAAVSADVEFLAVNDAPTITNLNGDTLNYTEGDGAVVVEQGGNAVVSDVDSANFDTGTLTVAFSAGSDSAEDVLAIRNQGTAAGQVGVSGSDVTFGGTVIGSFTGGSLGTDLVVTFDANATSVGVTMVMQNVTYENTDLLTPTAGPRTVDFVVTDGDGGTSLTHSATVNVNSTNNAPTIVNLSGDTLSYAEGDGQQPIEQSGDALVADVDSLNFDTGTLTVSFTAGSDTAEDVLSIVNQGTGSGQIGFSGSNVSYEGTTIGTFTGGTGGVNLVITLNANADGTATSALVQAVSYENTDTDNPTTGARTIRYVLTDGDGGTSANHDVTVNVTDVNDIPTLTAFAVPVDTTNEDTEVEITFTELATQGNEADVDGTVDAFAVKSVTSGTLRIGSSTGTATAFAAGTNDTIDATNRVYWTPINNANGTQNVFQVVAQDDDGGESTGNVQVQVNVTAVNDDPTGSGSLTTTSLNDNAGATNLFGGLTVSDVDTGENDLSVTITLTDSSAGTVVGGGFSDLGGGVYRATGLTVATANTALDNATFTPTNNSGPSGAFNTDIGVAVNDQGGSGEQTVLTPTTVTITRINDDSTITNLAGDTLSYTEGAGVLIIEQGGNAVVSDVDSSDFNGGTLTVSFSAGSDAAEDVLAIRNQGTNAGQVGISGSNVTFGGTTIGTFTGGSGGADLVVTFNASATSVAVTQVVQNATYENTNILLPTTGARTVDFQVTDGDGGTSSSHAATVNVDGSNDAPILSSIEVADLGYTENDAATTITSTLAVNDVDDLLLESAVVQITGNFVTGEDVLTFANQNGISGTFNSTNGRLSLTGTSTVANYQTALRSVTYTNTSELPDTTNRTVTFTVNDGDTNSSPQTRDIAITSENDNPTNAGTLPAGVIVTEDVSSNVDLSAVDFSDVDANGSTLTVTLSTGTGGQLSASSFAGVTVSGTATARAFTGSLTNLNNYFNDASRLQYLHGTPHTAGNSADSITVVINDSGNTGDGGGADQTLGTVTVDITAVDDRPTLTAFAAPVDTTNEDTQAEVTFAELAAQGNETDVDGTVTAFVVKSVPSGTLLIGTSAGTATAYAAGTNDTIDGSNNAYWSPTLNSNGTINAFTVVAEDNGGLESIGDIAVQVDVTAQNDAPVMTAGATLNWTEGSGPLVIDTSITVSDVDDTLTESAVVRITSGLDSGNDVLGFTLSGGVSGSTWVPSTGTLTLTGTATLAEYQTVLRTVTFNNTSPTPSTLDRTITWTVFDGDVNSADVTSTVRVAATNNAPVFDNNQLTILEGGTITLSSTELSATDADHADSGLAFTVSGVTAGHFELISAPQTAITGFTQAQITGSQFVFVHDGSESAPTYSVTVSDGTTNVGPAAATITFTNVNDAPTLAAIGGDSVTIFNDGTSATIDTGKVAVLVDSDAPPDYDGGFLQITGNSFQAADQLGLRTTGTVSLSAGFSNGSVVSVSGVNVGTLASVSSSAARIDFNANATAAHIETLLQETTFATTSATLGARTVDFTFNDGDGTANGGAEISSTETVNIFVAQAGNGLVTTDEDTTYTFVATDFDFTGLTGSDLQQIEIMTLPVEGTLRYNGGTATIGQIVTKADIDGGLLRFVPDAEQNGAGYASFDFRINNGKEVINVLAGEPNSFTLDGGFLQATDAILASAANFGASGVYSSFISVGAASSTIDSAYLSQGEVLFNGYVQDTNWTAAELTALNTWVNGGGVLISNSDDASYDAVSNFYGLTIGGTASTTWHIADAASPIMNGPFGLVGNNGDPFSASGSISYFDSASLAVGDQVLATDSGSGEPTIVVRQVGSGWILFTSDEGIFRAGMTGGGAISTANDRLAANIFAWAADQVPATSSHTMQVDVTAVNDDPTDGGSLPGTVTVTEDVPTAVDFSGIDVEDIDSATGSLEMTLTTSGGGTLSAIGSGGVSVSGGGSGILTLSGTQTDLNTFLNNTSNISFSSALNASGAGPDSIQVDITDNGNVGTGGGGTINFGTVSVNITAVNDAPVNTVPGTQTVVEETQTAITGLSIADVDAGAGTVTAQLQVTAGVLDVTLSGLATISAGANGSVDLTISGTVADINATLASLRYTPNNNVTGLSADTLTVTTDDGGNFGGAALQDIDTVSINVTNVNDEEAVITNTGLTTADISEGDTGVVITQAMLETTDVDNTPSQLVYTLTTPPSQGDLRLSGILLIASDTFTQLDINNGLLTFDHNDSESFADSFAFNVNDGSGTVTSDTFNIDVNPVNDNAPIITSDGGGATAALTRAENTTSVTTVTATDADLPSQTLSYALAGGADQARFSIDSGSGVLTFSSAPNFEAPADANTNNVYDVVVEVSDGLGLTVQQTISVTVSDSDEFDVAPISDSDGKTNAVNENSAVGTTVGITALATDGDGTDNVTYDLADDAGGRFAIDANSGVVTVAGALDRESAASHTITVRASSTDASQSLRTFTVAVNDVDEFDATPILDNNAATDQVTENVPIGSVVGITAFSQDLDATTDTITYSLDNDAGGLFTIDSATGIITTAATIDYEVTGNSQAIVARATSADSSTTSQSYTITVLDVDEFDVTPIVDNDATADQIDENVAVGTTVGITAFSQDSDGTNNSVDYSLDDDAGNLFTIDSVTGVVTTAAAIDFESTGGSLNITVRATSEDTSTTARTFTISVNDLNDNAPVVTSGQSSSLSEFATNGTSVGFAAATDADTVGALSGWAIVTGNSDGVFGINAATGELTVNDTTNLNFESTPTYSLTLTVSDGVATSVPQTVDVVITNENDAPVLSAVTLSVNENSANGSVVGTMTASDEDAGETLTYSIAGAAGQPFAIDSSTGVITVADVSQLDFETTTSFTITVNVTDSGSLTDTQLVIITVHDLNEDPVDITLVGGVVAENSATGTFVATVAGTDVDAGDVLTYSLVDNPGDRFAVNAATGTVTVAVGSRLNFENASSHTISVRATDTGGLTYDESFAITLTDVNEAPTASDDSVTGDQLEDLNVPAGLVLSNDFDVDGDGISVVLVDPPLQGTVILNPDGSFTYTPEGSFSGLDSFTYYATDGSLDSNVATVNIEILATLTGPSGGDGNGDDALPEIPTSPFAPDSEDTPPSPDDRGPSDEEALTDVATQFYGSVRSDSSNEDEDGGGELQDPQQTMRQSGNVTSPAIFLDDVPEGEYGDTERRENRRDERRGKEDRLDRAEFLFSPIVTTNPFFGGQTFELAPTSFGQQGEASREFWREKFVVGSSAVGASTLSVGYIAWMLRGGALLTSFLSSLPAWQSFDPLAILENSDECDEDDNGDESLLSIAAGH